MGVFKYDCYKFPTESNSESILNIGLTFGEVTDRSIVSCFFDPLCIRSTHNPLIFLDFRTNFRVHQSDQSQLYLGVGLRGIMQA